MHAAAMAVIKALTEVVRMVVPFAAGQTGWDQVPISARLSPIGFIMAVTGENHA
jgi:hypothetical protein